MADNGTVNGDETLDENQEQNSQGQTPQGSRNPGFRAADAAGNLAGNAEKASRKLGSAAGNMREKATAKREEAKRKFSHTNAVGAAKREHLIARAERLEQRAGKLEKLAKKTEKVAKKAEKFSKFAMKIGKILMTIGWILLLLMAIIGLLVFIITGFGMLLEGFKQIAEGFYDTCVAILAGGEENVKDDEIINLMDNIQEMGYDLYGYGFVTAKDESAKDANGNYQFYEQNEEGKKSLLNSLEKKDAYRNITTYLISDNYAYYIKNNNFNFRSMTTDAKHFFGGIFNRTKWGSGLISVYKQKGDSNTITGERGEVYGNTSVLNLAATVGAGAAIGTVVPIPGIGTGVGAAVGGIIAGIKTIAEWDELTSDIKINRNAEQLEISAIGLFKNQTFTYSLDGWTGRYSMPLEFLLATHVATMAPDLSYKLATSFNTDVEILLAKTTDNSQEGGVRVEETGEVITRSAFKEDFEKRLIGSSLTGEAGVELFKDFPDLASRKEEPYKCEMMDQTSQTGTSTSLATSDNFIEIIADNIKRCGGEYTIDGKDITQDVLKSHINEADLKDGSSGVLSAKDTTYGYDYKINYEITAQDDTYFNVTVTINQTITESGKTCSEKIRAGEDIDEVCPACRTYLTLIYHAMDKLTVNDFDTFVPYINCVTDHWYRNVYFTENALREYESDGEYVLTDIGYEDKTGERWTLYEQDRGNRYKDELYVYLPDDTGNYSGKKFATRDEKYLLCREVGNGKGNYNKKGDGEATYVKQDKGNYQLFLLENSESDDASTRYKEYTGNDITEFKVSRKAKTAKKEAGWNAYDEAINVNVTNWTAIEEENITDSELKAVKDLGLTPVYKAAKGDVVQSDDGVRGQTNSKIKKLFLDNYYMYDGTGTRAALIEKAKNMVQDKIDEKISAVTTSLVYSADPTSIAQQQLAAKQEIEEKYDVDDPDAFIELCGKDTEIKATYNDQEVAAKIDEISSSVNLAQNSLTAFNILRNMHTLDSEYIYHDFKELAVELNYFDKEELTEVVSEVMMFPISDTELSSAGWPVTRYDKSEEFYGTLIHSAEDYKAMRAETEAELKELREKEIEEETENEKQTIAESDTSDTYTVNVSDNTNTINISAEDFVNVAKECHDGQTSKSYVYGAGSYPTNSSDSGIDCSHYVSCVLYDAGIYTSSYMTSRSMVSVLLSLGGEIVTDKNQLQPGDICFYGGTGKWEGTDSEIGNTHVDIFVEYQNEVMYGYNCGGNSSVQASEVTEIDRSDFCYAVRLPFNGSSSSTVESAEFAGFQGGEPVLAPVTGEVVKYGTLTRTNMELLNNGVSEEDAKEEVGFIKIRVLGNTECLAGTDSECNFFNRGKKQNGYNYFWKEYADAGITDHVLYLEGFDVSKILGSGSHSARKDTTGSNIENLKNYILKEENAEDSQYATDYEVPKFVGNDAEERTKELQDKEDAKKDADYAIEKGGKIYIKEGAVIGYTYETDNAKTVSKEVEVTKAQLEADAEEKAEKDEAKTTGKKKKKNKNKSTKAKKKKDEAKSEAEDDASDEMVKTTYQVGNYMRMIFRDTDDQVVENVEDYIEIDEVEGTKKGIDTQFPEEFLYWEGIYVEGGINRNGDYYTRSDLSDGKMTTAFGLTEDCQDTAENLGYNNYITCLTNGQIPVQMAQDVFIGEMEADRAAILNAVGSLDKLTESGLDALVSIYHNSPERALNLVDILNSKGSLTEDDFVSQWGSNSTYEESLKRRRRGEYILYNEGKYPAYNDGGPPFKCIEFKTETPWTDFCNGKSNDQIMSWK